MRKMRRNGRSAEEQRLLAEARQANEELKLIYKQLSYVTEPAMIDATIFQLNAAQKRYEHLVGIMKEKQLVNKQR